RQHKAMVHYWSRTSLSLTKKVIQYLYGPGFSLPLVSARKSDIHLPTNLNNEFLIQSWFRILHIIGNPTDLCKREIISSSPKFKEFALASGEVVSPEKHPCLQVLPQNFLQAMKGIAVLVDAFLSSTTTLDEPVKHTPIPAPTKSSSPLSIKKRDQKAQGVGVALGLSDQTGLITRSQTAPSRRSDGTPSTGKPQVSELSNTLSASVFFPQFSATDGSKPSGDSVLHLFGSWLFDAVFAKLDMPSNLKALAKVYDGFLGNAVPEIAGIAKLGFQSVGNGFDSQFEPGRAEAYGALSRIFCSHRSGEEIRPVYLSRFYLALAIGLLYTEGYGKQELMKGCKVRVENGLENMTTGWRKKHLNEKQKGEEKILTFLSLKPRLIRLLLEALQSEVDSFNVQILLGGLCFFVLIFSDLSTLQGLFVQLTHLLCNKLVVIRSSRWKGDLHITLAAFELLSGLSKLSMNHLDQAECKSTIHWLCDYVTYQANKKATHHSRDLHSMIVAAIACIQSWIMSHPWLLDSQGCLKVVMEVVELGISGSKSRESPNVSSQKELKPVSFRVREAAEGLLTVIMEHLGAFPSPCGPASLSSLLDEEWVLDHVCPAGGSGKTSRKFQYYVIPDCSIIMGLLEESLKPRDPLPTLSAVVRGPSGRYVWSMQLRQFSREKNDLIEAHLKDPGRPFPDKTQPRPPPSNKHRVFPESVDLVPPTNADRSIPELDDILDTKLSEVQDHMRTLMQKQLEHEKVAQTKLNEDKKNVKFPDKDTEIRPPQPCKTFRPARLLLSHLGLLSIEGLKGNSIRPFEDASLVALNSKSDEFFRSLKELDHLSARTQDTVYVFYVKAEQRSAHDIIENKISTCKHSKAFNEFLLSLGWLLDVASHPGWAGNIQEAWKRGGNDSSLRPTDSSFPKSTQSKSIVSDSSDRESTGNEEANKRKSSRTVRFSSPLPLPKAEPVDEILYFANVSCEVAFIMPSLLPHYQEFRCKSGQTGSPEEEIQPTPRRRTRSGSTGSLETLNSSQLDLKSKLLRQTSGGVISQESRVMSRFGNDLPLESRPLSRSSTHNTSSETNVLVAWLERFEDHTQFPVDELLMEFDFSDELGHSLREKDTVVIFIHHLRSGLYRIHIRSTIRSPIGGPLVDGMVVSRRALGTMVRQTAINICRRRRLEIDS
ncbi:PREDICTED: ral GTPase-activating protein subunit beta-like, partial [Acropora digitifera]|uniref:ral GTPase-activating protein subunit beta-like n=1 Tax=Acropora digitifera TaxID=70779 RepID=UPI00077B1A4C